MEAPIEIDDEDNVKVDDEATKAVFSITKKLAYNLLY